MYATATHLSKYEVNNLFVYGTKHIHELKIIHKHDTKYILYNIIKRNAEDAFVELSKVCSHSSAFLYHLGFVNIFNAALYLLVYIELYFEILKKKCSSVNLLLFVLAFP